ERSGLAILQADRVKSQTHRSSSLDPPGFLNRTNVSRYFSFFVTRWIDDGRSEAIARACFLAREGVVQADPELSASRNYRGCCRGPSASCSSSLRVRREVRECAQHNDRNQRQQSCSD